MTTTPTARPAPGAAPRTAHRAGRSSSGTDDVVVAARRLPRRLLVDVLTDAGADRVTRRDVDRLRWTIEELLTDPATGPTRGTGGPTVPGTRAHHAAAAEALRRAHLPTGPHRADTGPTVTDDPDPAVAAVRVVGVALGLGLGALAALVAGIGYTLGAAFMWAAYGLTVAVFAAAGLLAAHSETPIPSRWQTPIGTAAAVATGLLVSVTPALVALGRW